jgi:hypothetical protein
MDQNLDFQFSVPKIPEGEALTFDEIEERCLKQLQVHSLKHPRALRPRK